MICAKCGKAPARKTIATRTSQLGDHVVVEAKRDALVCDCGVLAWDPPTQTAAPFAIPAWPRPFVYPIYPQPTTVAPPRPMPQIYPQWIGGSSAPLQPPRSGTIC